MKSITGMIMLSAVLMSNADAAIITFDNAISGQTTYDFDGDGDGTVDVRFSTTDSAGFNTVGPGPNMTYVNQPGLEGTALLDPDLRVDFLNGAVNMLRFGFALSNSAESDAWFANFRVYDSNNNLLADATEIGRFTPTQQGQSSFPEGLLTVNFSGVAAYGLFNFTSQGRYLMDNFEGTFGSTESAQIAAASADTPEPATTALLGAGLAGIALLRRRMA